MHPYLNIDFLHLIGHRKNYTIPFYPGVNIIYGDSDTGKSSILEFINYLLGASSVVMADEISSSITYAALEIRLNGVEYTIKRDVFKPAELVEVYPCIFSECANNYPKKYAHKFGAPAGPDGYLSDFFMSELGLPKINIKVSPTKADSNLKRLSFRDIYKFSYLDQDEVGSKNLLDSANWSLFASNKEVFKYIFNVLDTSISELEQEISEQSKTARQYKSKYESVSEFLRETDYESQSSIDDSLEAIDEAIDELERELQLTNSKMVSNSNQYESYKAAFNMLSLNEKGLAQELSNLREQLDRYSRLKNDYENDIDKVEATLSAHKKIGEIKTIPQPCPICDSPLEDSAEAEPFISSGATSLSNELDSLKKKRKSIQSLISELSEKQRERNSMYFSVHEDLLKARELLDTESESMITPYLTQRDALVKELSAKRQFRSQLVVNLKIRNSQKNIYDQYEHCTAIVAQLEERLAELRKSAPSLDSVLSELSDNLNRFLRKVNIKNRRGISISPRNFLPVIRDREYMTITSGGLRTISSIGLLLSIFEYAIDNEINHPAILLIDTVGKYLGKTSKAKHQEETDSAADADEGLSDPEKYKNMYEYMFQLAGRAEEKGVQCQIILVDNDVPDSFVAEFKPYIVAHYSSTGENGLPKGLIDDYYS
ncbi:TPA: AAA family ATPase [Pseudomonas aeruginosa]|uniref:AAA family ATPase n=1 Tax=Pseudomonas aeruginosa TaxID=287 RepID=UPI000F841D25|nr:AAA family ATPase [Pseudomonas aeruginosa]MBG4156480.1 AAA family ATPase [Pseudomonas aeruginosa]MBG4168776.1 AAA family ATPase [Pseudomonas aeruginosa]MBG4487286.1 AAA family ATPase [Pseudomonas aeruginosa]MBG4499701.1 AAA family ATPase [Pseudomonas aeruginosa]RTR70085.1 exonuclease SbcC [Pseudomonas aeruginosa]